MVYWCDVSSCSPFLSIPIESATEQVLSFVLFLSQKTKASTTKPLLGTMGPELHEVPTWRLWSGLAVPLGIPPLPLRRVCLFLYRVAGESICDALFKVSIVLCVCDDKSTGQRPAGRQEYPSCWNSFGFETDVVDGRSSVSTVGEAREPKMSDRRRVRSMTWPLTRYHADSLATRIGEKNLRLRAHHVDRLHDPCRGELGGV